MQPMLTRLAGLLERLRIDPATTRLRWWLAGSEVVIVLMVAGGLSLYAGGRLRQLVDSQGTARGTAGWDYGAGITLRRMQEDALGSARSIGDDPSLQAALRATPDDTHAQALDPVLRRLCPTDTADACAVFDGGRLLSPSRNHGALDRSLLEHCQAGADFPGRSCDQYHGLVRRHRTGERTPRP